MNYVATPFLKWAGGKRQLLPEIRKHVPERFGTYYEPFVGGGAVFFDLHAAGRISKAWLGDVNMQLMLAYAIVRDEVEALIEMLLVHARQHSEEHFYETRSVRCPPPITGVARTIYLNKTCFNGLYRVNRAGNFNVPFGKYPNPNICDAENLRACSAALKGVELNCVPFNAVTARSGDFVYFDPPYWPVNETSDFTGYTAGGFGGADQERLAEHARWLKETGVHVLLSNADLPQVRKLYEGFEMRTVQAKRAINSKGGKRGTVGELLIW